MSTEQTTYSTSDIEVMLVRAQRFNLIIDQLIFMQGYPDDSKKWIEFAEDVGALNHAINEELTAARIALDHHVPDVRHVQPEPGSSVPSSSRHTKSSSKAAEKATT